MSPCIPTTLIMGDGIGPQVVGAAVEVLEALGAPFEWDLQEAGLGAFERTGDALPQPTIDSIRRNRLALKGPLTTPIGGGFRSATVRMRQALDLFANVRPTRTLVPGRYDKVDIVVIRENLEGLYAASERYVPEAMDPGAVAIATAFNSRAECHRVMRFAFDYAVRHGRRKITVVHKANILKAFTGILLEAGRAVADEYRGRVELDDLIVDACAMHLVLDPQRFDMIVTTNLFGDILSDLTAGLVGGLGLAAGANMGEGVAVFEAIHGSAPSLAGTGKANPVALLLAAQAMLDHVGESERAERLGRAITFVLNEERVLTPDLGGSARTEDVTLAVKRRL
ncbi:isocitrate/isopropylmalate dehydrogenase family protein [Pseudochelatococcus sp. B33]